ncbi:MAG: nucleotidyltransferase family protein [Rhodothermaceae bacterium]|nr:nucleotidyltransferase family protein [Rhodothermaceae bacterium]
MKEAKTSSLSAVVLAAGESRRMGAKNKLLLPYKSKAVIAHVVEAILASDVRQVHVVVGHEQERVREALQSYSVSFVENPDYEQGMGTSIRAGVRHAEEDVAGYMICLSDLPLITADEYSHLAQAFLAHHQASPHAIAVPRFEGQRGNPVTLSSIYRPAMLSHQGIMGCRGIVKQHPEHVHFVDMSTDHVLRDVDTPEAFSGLP